MLFIPILSLYKLIFDSIQLLMPVVSQQTRPPILYFVITPVFHLCGWCGIDLKFPNEILWLLSMLKAYLPSYTISNLKNCSSGDFYSWIFKFTLVFQKRPSFPSLLNILPFCLFKIWERFFNTWDFNKEVKYSLTDFIGFHAFMRFWNLKKKTHFIATFHTPQQSKYREGRGGKSPKDGRSIFSSVVITNFRHLGFMSCFSSSVLAGISLLFSFSGVEGASARGIA